MISAQSLCARTQPTRKTDKSFQLNACQVRLRTNTIIYCRFRASSEQMTAHTRTYFDKMYANDFPRLQLFRPRHYILYGTQRENWSQYCQVFCPPHACSRIVCNYRFGVWCCEGGPRTRGVARVELIIFLSQTVNACTHIYK